MKKLWYIGLMFLAILLLCATTPLVQGATHVSVTWGSTYHPYSPDDPQVPNWFNLYEKPAQSSAAAYITGLVSQAGANWVGANNYGSSTTASNVYANSQAIQSSSAYDFLSTFHVGDFYPIPTYNGNNVRHYAYYSSSSTGFPGIIDAELYTYTGAKHKFTFIWTCVNGGTSINGVNNYGYMDSYNKAVGMPLAWTKQTNLSKDGYANPDSSGYAYIGFENTSKFLSDNTDFVTYNYGDFCKEYYKNLYVNHYSVKLSLDLAAAKVMGGSQYKFSNTVIYNGYTFYSSVHQMTSTCYMRVIGNGNMVLPY